MYTTYHFKSTTEITGEVIAAIKAAFQEKPVVLTIEEDTVPGIPEWHKKLVYDRLEEIEQHPDKLLSAEAFQQKLERIRK